MSDHITAHPLTWPEGWERSPSQEHARFTRKTGSHSRRNVTISEATRFVMGELERMGIDDWNVIISSNLKLRQDGLPISGQRDPDDNGVSVWWKTKGTQKVIAIDKYYRAADNLYAIGKTIEALRGIERWGSGEILERTFTGFTAVTYQPDDWRATLDYYGESLSECKAKYREKIRKAHPDSGGTDAEAARVNAAWEAAQEVLS